MNASQARAILTQAKADETYEADPPEDDAKAVEEAEGLVKMAQDAWDQNIRGPQVESILRLAAEDGNGAEPAAESPPPKEEESESSSVESQEIESAFGLSDEDMTRMQDEEPWEEYDSEKVSEIVEAVEIGMEADDDPMDLLAHVWVYESAHKGRVRILRRLEEIGAQFGPAAETPGDTESEPSSPDAPDDGSDEEGTEEGQEGGEAPSEPASEPPDVEEEPEPAEVPAPDEPAEEIDEPEAYRNLLALAEREVSQQRSHVPSAPPSDEDFDLPFDYTTLSDRELQTFYGVYTNLAYYTNYRVLIEEARARLCREAATELFNNLLVNSDKYDDHDKQKTMTILEAEVNSDENVKLWKRRQRKHEAFAKQLHNERDGYNKIVESLSRLETMRHQEFERSGGKAGRR